MCRAAAKWRHVVPQLRRAVMRHLYTPCRHTLSPRRVASPRRVSSPRRVVPRRGAKTPQLSHEMSTAMRAGPLALSSPLNFPLCIPFQFQHNFIMFFAATVFEQRARFGDRFVSSSGRLWSGPGGTVPRHCAGGSLASAGTARHSAKRRHVGPLVSAVRSSSLCHGIVAISAMCFRRLFLVCRCRGA